VRREPATAPLWRQPLLVFAGSRYALPRHRAETMTSAPMRWVTTGEMTTMAETAHDLETRKSAAEAWFQALRDEIVAQFEKLEADLPETAPMAGEAVGRFVQTPWERTDHTGAPGGGGVMSLMKG